MSPSSSAHYRPYCAARALARRVSHQRLDSADNSTTANARLAALVHEGSQYFLQRRMLPYFAASLSTAIALTVFALTVSPDISWAYAGSDGGELITTAVTLGVPHPPGYPLYVLSGKLISLLPLGSVAFRFNLLSAICMAMSAGLLAGLTAGLLAGDTTEHPENERLGAQVGSVLWPAVFAGTTFAFVPLVWQQALIAEVYGLNMLAVSVLVWVIFCGPRRRAVGWLPGVALGVAVTTHLTSLLLLPAASRALKRGQGLRFVGGFAAGLAPFLLLPLLATSGSPVIWGWPRSFDGWWWMVSAEVYRPNVFALPISRWAERLGIWSNEPALWVAFALLAVVLIRRRSLSRILRHAGWILLVTPALYVVYAFGYDAPDAHVLLLPALGMLCVAGALALSTSWPWYLLLPLALLVLNFHWIDLSEHRKPRSLAESALREAPADAIILTSGDRTTFTLWYLQHVEGLRDDAVVVDDNLLAFDWYRTRLRQAYPDLVALDRDDLARFRQANARARPWCELRFGIDRVSHYSCTKEPL